MAAPRVHFKLYDQLDGRQQRLVQQVGSGSIIRRFDRTPLPSAPTDVVCPHFLELKWAYGCPYHCAWCYLQGTLRLLRTKTSPVVKDYRTTERHLTAFFHATTDSSTGRSLDYPAELLNTGEIADSLMWENNGNPFSRFVADVFETQSKHHVLFLSKCNAIDNILKLDTDLLIPSFTINSKAVAQRWERGAPSPTQRIGAAAALARSGYPVRVRIDPLVPIPNWRKSYRELLSELFDAFVPDRITLGSLRGLQSTVNFAHDLSWTDFLSEQSNWGRKVGLDQRYTMYSSIKECLKNEYEYERFALCKETLEMWQRLGINYLRIKCNCTL